MKRSLSILCVTALLLVALPLGAAEKAVETILPRACADGWVREGQVSVYTSENLYKYIDGEAELYMPYGFQRAATVMYVKPGSKEGGLVVNVFEMGSLLDAFGIYGNYRSPSVDRVAGGRGRLCGRVGADVFQGQVFRADPGVRNPHPGAPPVSGVRKLTCGGHARQSGDAAGIGAAESRGPRPSL